MALLFLPFVSMLNPRAHEVEIVSEEERRKREQGEEDKLGEEQPPTSPKATLMQPFLSMLKQRAREFNKNEAPKDERVRRVYNE